MNCEDMSDFEINKRALHFAIASGLIAYWDRTFYEYEKVFYHVGLEVKEFDPCNNPSNAWPIMMDNNIFIAPTRDDFEFKYMTKCLINGSAGLAWTSRFTSYSDNPLRAAMICFLKMKGAENDR
ncbi:NinX [Vibrio phage 1.201.B._10N.286.55.F1]|nr:NinX [Vibrio phage 1.201.B._10N.286.55.F1]